MNNTAKKRADLLNFTDDQIEAATGRIYDEEPGGVFIELGLRIETFRGCKAERKNDLKEALESIIGRFNEWHEYAVRYESDDDEERDAVFEDINNCVLCVDEANGWHKPGEYDSDTPRKYRLMLTFGGPTVY